MTPPPAASAAAAPNAGDSKINRDLLRVMDGVSPGYFLLLGVTLLGVTAAALTKLALPRVLLSGEPVPYALAIAPSAIYLGMALPQLGVEFWL